MRMPSRSCAVAPGTRQSPELRPAVAQSRLTQSFEICDCADDNGIVAAPRRPSSSACGRTWSVPIDPDAVYGEPIVTRVYSQAGTSRVSAATRHRGLISFRPGVLVELFASTDTVSRRAGVGIREYVVGGGRRRSALRRPAIVYDNHPYREPDDGDQPNGQHQSFGEHRSLTTSITGTTNNNTIDNRRQAAPVANGGPAPDFYMQRPNLTAGIPPTRAERTPCPTAALAPAGPGCRANVRMDVRVWPAPAVPPRRAHHAAQAFPWAPPGQNVSRNEPTRFDPHQQTPDRCRTWTHANSSAAQAAQADAEPRPPGRTARASITRATGGTSSPGGSRQTPAIRRPNARERKLSRRRGARPQPSRSRNVRRSSIASLHRAPMRSSAKHRSAE